MFTRIILAVDRTESGDVAASFTSGLARRSDAEVRVVHVNELLVGGRGFAAETEVEAMDIVDTAVARLRADGVRADGVHFLANCFTVGDRIADAALEWGADVVVFGSKRRRWLPRLAGRSLREHVAARTGLPTLVAPAPLRLGRGVDQRELVPATPQAPDAVIVS